MHSHSDRSSLGNLTFEARRLRQMAVIAVILILPIASCLSLRAQSPAAPLLTRHIRMNRLASTSDAEMLQAFDMSAPGMDGVKTAAERDDLAGVETAYLQYRRELKSPRWYQMPSDMPPATARDDAIGDEILGHLIRDYAYGNFGRRPVHMGADFDWTYNPVPPTDPSYSDEWTWCAISRMQFWRKLADAYWKTHDEKYAQEWVKELFDFAAKEPLTDAGRGGQISLWRTLDASIRANETWPYAYYHMIDSPAFTPDAQWTYVKLIRDHAMLLERALKAPGRMGNWVASESYGLYTIGLLFPEIKESAEWRNLAIDRIMQEMNTVVPPDGFEAELTPNYDLVSLHGYLGPLKLAQLNHVAVPAELKPKLLSMFEALVEVMDQNGEVVATNDSGRVRAVQSAREGLTLGDDPLLEWAVSHGAQGKGLPDSTMLPYAGFFTMRSGWKPGDQFFFFRAGPAGIGHEHEDDLQIVYEAFGKTLLREGPLSRYDHSDFRRFALETGAYSTVTIDGMSQHRGPNKSPINTPAPATWVTSPLFDYAAATYDGGYQKSVYAPIEYHPEKWIGALDKSITHTRRIVYLRPYYVLVLDSVNGPGRHTADARFDMDGPSAKIDQKTQAAYSQNSGSAQIALFPLDRNHLTASILQGARGAPDIVWNLPTIQYEKAQDLPAMFATLLYPYQGAAPAIQESGLATDVHDVWARSIATPLESIAVIAAKSGRSASFNAQSPIDANASATATLLIERKPNNAPNAGVKYGALQLTAFRNSALRFTAERPADLLFTIEGGKPILFNAGTKEVRVKLTRPFTKSIAIAPGTTVEIARSHSHGIDGAKFFAFPPISSESLSWDGQSHCGFLLSETRVKH